MTEEGTIVVHVTQNWENAQGWQFTEGETLRVRFTARRITRAGEPIRASQVRKFELRGEILYRLYQVVDGPKEGDCLPEFITDAFGANPPQSILSGESREGPAAYNCVKAVSPNTAPQDHEQEVKQDKPIRAVRVIAAWDGWQFRPGEVFHVRLQNWKVTRAGKIVIGPDEEEYRRAGTELYEVYEIVGGSRIGHGLPVAATETISEDVYQNSLPRIQEIDDFGGSVFQVRAQIEQIIRDSIAETFAYYGLAEPKSVSVTFWPNRDMPLKIIAQINTYEGSVLCAELGSKDLYSSTWNIPYREAHSISNVKVEIRRRIALEILLHYHAAGKHIGLCIEAFGMLPKHDAGASMLAVQAFSDWQNDNSGSPYSSDAEIYLVPLIEQATKGYWHLIHNETRKHQYDVPYPNRGDD